MVCEPSGECAALECSLEDPALAGCPDGSACTADGVCRDVEHLAACGACDGGCASTSTTTGYVKACISKTDRNTMRSSGTIKITDRIYSGCSVRLRTYRDKSVGATLIKERYYSCPPRDATASYSYSVDTSTRGEYYSEMAIGNCAGGAAGGHCMLYKMSPEVLMTP